ncbi:hypothetical protein BDZ89DRAFT_1049603 [Hymenopellis radicata]|nr:hypothetical protein BDZ89DRAFT_1049603 [Hymenopellis radicata]
MERHAGPTNSTGYDFHVTMDGWNFTGDSKSTSLSRNGAFVTNLDPHIPVTIMPQADATLLYANIPGAAVSSNDTSSTTVWEVPCSSVFSVSFVFGNVTLTLDHSSLAGSQQQSGKCTGTIEGWSSSQDQFLLGSNFLASAYVSNAQNNKTSKAAIAGMVLGSLSFALALGIVGFLVYRRKSRNGQKFELVEADQEHLRLLLITILQCRHKPIRRRSWCQEPPLIGRPLPAIHRHHMPMKARRLVLQIV